jgi:hypothetical protein
MWCYNKYIGVDVNEKIYDKHLHFFTKAACMHNDTIPYRLDSIDRYTNPISSLQIDQVDVLILGSLNDIAAATFFPFLHKGRRCRRK